MPAFQQRMGIIKFVDVQLLVLAPVVEGRREGWPQALPCLVLSGFNRWLSRTGL